MDPEIVLVGYQVSYEQLAAGLFLFTHTRSDCGTTVSIRAGQFTDLYAGPIFRERQEKTTGCTGQCERRDDLQPCPRQCECAFVREVLDRVRTWPKKAVAS